jgi:regulator of sigma E protease
MVDLPNWLLIVPVLAFLIFVHELGHFTTAKLFGIKVTEFGFGFPPRIFGVPYRGTVYSLNLIPLGGFVKMVGEEDPSDPDSFARHSVLKRLVVLSAGSIMNFVLPVVIFTILLMLPHDALVGGSVLITAVAPGSPAEQAGLRGGDAILAVDGKPVISPGELVETVRGRSGQPIELSLRRASRVMGLSQSPELATFDAVTVTPRVSPPRLRVVDEITDPSSEVSLSDARRYNPDLEVGDTMTQGAIGVMIGLVNRKSGTETEPVWSAVPNAVATIWSVLTFTWGGITEGVATRSNPGITGPVGIAHATDEVVEELGVAWIFRIAALLSVSLGVVNLLPIPALDGGRIVFVVLEFVRRGKRISPQREGLIHLVGFVVIIGLIVAITYSDIVRIVNGESFLR